MKGETHAQFKFFNRGSTLVCHAVQAIFRASIPAKDAKEGSINHADIMGRLRDGRSSPVYGPETSSGDNSTYKQKCPKRRERTAPIYQTDWPASVQILDNIHRIGTRRQSFSQALSQLQSTGKGVFQAAAIIAVISFYPRGAGAYTASQAAYGSIVTGLDSINNDLQSTLQQPSGGTNIANKSVFLTQQGTSVFQDSYAQSVFLDYGGLTSQNGVVDKINESYEAEIANALGDRYHSVYINGAWQLTGPPFTVFSGYNDANSGAIENVYSPSAFQWAPGITATGRFAIAQTGNSTSTTGIQQIWPVFNDQSGYSVFESPNGNSYTAWYPNNLETLLSGTFLNGSTNYKSAANTTNTPYSVFKDAVGGSVFSNSNGVSYFGAYKYLDPNYKGGTQAGSDNLTQFQNGSVFRDGQGYSVYLAGHLNTSSGTYYGTDVNTNGSGEWSQSVFKAGTGVNTAMAKSGVQGSVFITDDTQNENVGNSVFLDQYGNSYLDDITNALTIPINSLDSPYNDGYPISLAGPTPSRWTYDSAGTLLYETLGDYQIGSTNNQPLGLIQMIGASLGGVPINATFSGWGSTVNFTPSYPYLGAEAMQIPEGMTNAQWYNSQAETGWSNSFAYAFFNPPSGATAPIGLTPYLSALSGYEPGSAGETTKQQTAQSDWTTFFNNTQNQSGAHIDYASPTNPYEASQWTNGQTESLNGTTYTTGADIVSSGINPGIILEPVTSGAGFISTTPVTETQAATAAYTIFATYAQAGPLPPGYSGGITTTVLPGSTTPPYAAVPLTIIDAIMTDAEWWQTNMTWFIDFFTVMWMTYCSISILHWINWGLHAGDLPLRLVMRSGRADSDENAVLKPVPDDLNALAST